MEAKIGSESCSCSELSSALRELESAKTDIAALLWLNGNCEYCKYGKKIGYCGAERWICTLESAENCEPEWRGAAE